MLRFLAIIGLIMTSIWGTSNVDAADDGARVPSGIGALNIFMRYTAPTGTRRGVPVLILHGATFPSANAAGWKFDGRSWMDELASAGYDVYALDFLGYGVSDRYPEMSSAADSGAPLGDVASMITQVESAVQYIFKVHRVKTVNLVAHSAGTYVAARYAELHPQDVERVVLFGAPAPYNGPTKVDVEAVRYLQVGREDQLEAFEPRVRDSHLLDPAMFDTWIRAYLATDPASASRAPPSVRVPAGLTAAYEEMLRSGRLPYDPSNITVPMLIIQGEWDSVAPPAAGLWIYNHLASPLKRYVIISKAGHRAHLERNRWQLYSETESFLGGVDCGAVYAVFFEVKPNGDRGREDYLAEAKTLKARLLTMSGFIDVERFASETRPGWLLSLSKWRDEYALVAWREVFEHRTAQEKGRHGVFEDYRIRVAKQVDSGGDFVLAEGVMGSGGAQTYTSLNDPSRHVALIEKPNTTTGTHWQVIRDYGLQDRQQAPHQ